MRYFSLFSGIGGFEVGIENSNVDFECVGYSEVDKYATSIYKRHFPNQEGFGDVTKIETGEMPKFNFLVGGFPCQSFSISGNRKGLDDTRGTLFFEIARILEDKKPKYFLLENVRNLLSHDGGNTFKTIIRVLTDLGYNVEWEIYNSCNYGVPQRRERIFLKGHRRGRSRRKILPFRKNCRKSMEIECHQLNNHKKTYQDGRIYDIDGAAICLNARGNNGWYQLSDNKSMTCTKEGVSFALTTRNRGMPFKKHLDNYILESEEKSYKIRKLTPIECERLQGFEDNWTKYGANDELISDTQRYKCIGNAVTTNVITAIINEMFGG